MPSLHRVAVTVLLALILGGALALVFQPSFYAPYAEGRDYVAIANGDYSHLYSYYAGRVLHPLVARLVASITRTPLDAHVFVWISIASLLAFFCCLGLYHATKVGLNAGLWLLLLVTPTILDSYRNYYWQDLFYAALCALFFLLLRARVWTALPILFLLYLTRESTLLLVLGLVFVAAVRREWKFGLAAALVGVAGMKVDAALVARALPNHHGISTALLDVLKIPYNFAFNVCGLEFWTNTNAATLDPPTWVARVPAWLHLGNIREIGYSGFSWTRPAQTLLILSTAFGLLPIAIIRAAKNPRNSHRFSSVTSRSEDAVLGQQQKRYLGALENFPRVRNLWRHLLLGRRDIAVASVYGTLVFVLTPLIGTTPSRYVLYAWPLFWLFGISILQTVSSTTQKYAHLVHFVLLSVCAAWIPTFVRLVTGPSIGGPQSFSTIGSSGLIVSLALVGPIYIWGWYVLGGNRPNVAGQNPHLRKLLRPPGVPTS